MQKILITDKEAAEIKFTKDHLQNCFLDISNTAKTAVEENIDKYQFGDRTGERDREDFLQHIYDVLKNEIRNGELSDKFSYSRCLETNTIVEQRLVTTKYNNRFLAQYIKKKGGVTIVAYLVPREEEIF